MSPLAPPGITWVYDIPHRDRGDRWGNLGARTSPSFYQGFRESIADLRQNRGHGPPKFWTTHWAAARGPDLA